VLLRESSISSLDDSDLILGQSVQLIHQCVNLLVGGGDGALERFLLVRGFGLGQLLFFVVSSRKTLRYWSKRSTRRLTASGAGVPTGEKIPGACKESSQKAKGTSEDRPKSEVGNQMPEFRNGEEERGALNARTAGGEKFRLWIHAR
jgi:hypothetical protein